MYVYNKQIYNDIYSYFRKYCAFASFLIIGVYPFPFVRILFQRTQQNQRWIHFYIAAAPTTGMPEKSVMYGGVASGTKIRIIRICGRTPDSTPPAKIETI